MDGGRERPLEEGFDNTNEGELRIGGEDKAFRLEQFVGEFCLVVKYDVACFCLKHQAPWGAWLFYPGDGVGVCIEKRGWGGEGELSVSSFGFVHEDGEEVFGVELFHWCSTDTECFVLKSRIGDKPFAS